MKWFRKIGEKDEEQEEEKQEENNQETMEFTIQDGIDDMRLKIVRLKNMLLNSSMKEVEEKIIKTKILELEALMDEFEKIVEKTHEEHKEMEESEKIRVTNIAAVSNKLANNTIINLELPMSGGYEVSYEIILKDAFHALQVSFAEKYKNVNREYALASVELIVGRIEQAMNPERFYTSEEKKEMLTYFENYLDMLDKRKELFDGLMKNQYLSKMKILEAKIKLLKVMVTGEGQVDFEKDRTQDAKSRLIYSRVVLEEATQFSKKIQELKQRKQSLIKSDEYSSELEQIEQQFKVFQERNRIYTLTEAEDEGEIFPMMLELMPQIYKEKQSILEEEKKQEKVLELKRMPEEEVKKGIDKIDMESEDMTQRLNAIMVYEYNILKAKGLLDEESIMEEKVFDDEKRRITGGSVNAVIKNAEELGIHYSICPELQDDGMKYIILAPIGKIEALKKSRFENGFVGEGPYIEGWYTEEFIAALQEKHKEKIRYSAARDVGYRKCICRCNSITISDIEQLIEEKNAPENVENIKFYIAVPYLRPIISILEKLQENGIHYWLEPMRPSQRRMREPFIHIYMDRKDLQNYKENVHPQIANVQDGMIKIVGEGVQLGDLLKKYCEIPLKKEVSL